MSERDDVLSDAPLDVRLAVKRGLEVDRRPCPWCGLQAWKYASLRRAHMELCDKRPEVDRG